MSKRPTRQKMSISAQIVSEMLAGYIQKIPYKPF